METKVCYKCKKELPVSSFKKHRSRKDGLQSDCIQCQKEYRQWHYKENKEKYIARAKLRKIRQRKLLREYIDGYKSERGCSRCDESHIACLDFHHIIPSDKNHAVSQMICLDRSLDDVKLEMSRCEVLCANCHRKHHWEEKQKNARSV